MPSRRQVDQFKVTIKGMCQPTILNTPENQHIACPTTDNTFSYETIVSVPRVCMRTFGFDKEDFPATLMLYETLEPLKEAAVYTPNSQMCGKLTITPQADNQIDEEWLEDYVLDKVGAASHAGRQAGRCPCVDMHVCVHL